MKSIKSELIENVKFANESLVKNNFIDRYFFKLFFKHYFQRRHYEKSLEMIEIIYSELQEIPSYSEKIQLLEVRKIEQKKIISKIEKSLMAKTNSEFDIQKYDVALDYIELEIERLKQIEILEGLSENTSKTDFKLPKLNESNKPVLTQAQISMLFSVMKDENIISNRDLTKKEYAKLLHFLTGYSENTQRQNFSSVQ